MQLEFTNQTWKFKPVDEEKRYDRMTLKNPGSSRDFIKKTMFGNKDKKWKERWNEMYSLIKCMRCRKE
jgi:hypothetical protein